MPCRQEGIQRMQPERAGYTQQRKRSGRDWKSKTVSQHCTALADWSQSKHAKVAPYLDIVTYVSPAGTWNE